MSDNDGASLAKLRKQFDAYASAKATEIAEQRQAWAYYHVRQFDKNQLKVLSDRKQPAIIFDRTSRKIDGLVGTIRRLRGDPKAFPRTANEEAGAEIATQVIRTILDQSYWEDIEVECTLDAAVHGIGVAQLQLEAGDHGDPDLFWERVNPRTFFYDPRCTRLDFAECRFMGTYKRVTLDELDEIVPGAADRVKGASEAGMSTAFAADDALNWTEARDYHWLIDHWYIEGGMWKWCLHTGSVELMRGETPFFNERGAPICKFIAFAGNIDHEGIRYGFVRRLKGPQDAMNQHRSKAIHIMNTRQLKVRKGAHKDIERLRREAMRPDGVLEYEVSPDELEVIQSDQEFLKQTQYYQDAKSEIETFGPNPALLGDMGASASGRAYAMAQQAGLAELGPFMKSLRSWKLEVYRASWMAAQRYWTSERLIRVTDDQELANFIRINGLEIDDFGTPRMVNALGSVNVEILIAEGPDTENVQGDVYDILTSLANNKIPIPPQVIIEVSNLPVARKKKIIEMMTAPDPTKQAAAQLELQGKAAEVQETQSRAALNIAKAQREGMPDLPQPDTGLPREVQVAQAVADIEQKQATALHRRAQAAKIEMDAMIAPAEAAARMASVSSAPRNGAGQRAGL